MGTAKNKPCTSNLPYKEDAFMENWLPTKLLANALG